MKRIVSTTKAIGVHDSTLTCEALWAKYMPEVPKFDRVYADVIYGKDGKRATFTYRRDD